MMRFDRAVPLAVIVVCGGISLGQAVDSTQRISLKLTLADGKEVRVTEIEGQTAEVKQAGPKGFHLGLVPTASKGVVAIQVVQLADGSRKTLAKVAAPVGEEMTVQLGDRTEPPTLRIVPTAVK